MYIYIYSSCIIQIIARSAPGRGHSVYTAKPPPVCSNLPTFSIFRLTQSPPFPKNNTKRQSTPFYIFVIAPSASLKISTRCSSQTLTIALPTVSPPPITFSPANPSPLTLSKHPSQHLTAHHAQHHLPSRSLTPQTPHASAYTSFLLRCITRCA